MAAWPELENPEPLLPGKGSSVRKVPVASSSVDPYVTLFDGHFCLRTPYFTRYTELPADGPVTHP